MSNAINVLTITTLEDSHSRSYPYRKVEWLHGPKHDRAYKGMVECREISSNGPGTTQRIDRATFARVLRILRNTIDAGHAPNVSLESHKVY